MALLEPKVEPLAPATPASATPPRTGSPPGRPEPLRRELTALLGADRVLARATRHRPLRLRRQPLPAVPEGRRDGARRRRRRQGARLRAADRDSRSTFRAGGTSLNGQGQSDGILVDVRRHFGGVEVLDDGARARVRPGTVLGHANRVLAPHGYKLGPDPASTDIACVGGVIANNSGGMRCGIARDSYSTVARADLRARLRDGDRHAAPPTPRSASPRPSPSSPPGCSRSATRSSPTPSWPSGSAASSRSRTRPATGSAPSSTPRRRSRSSAACWSARRARSRSSPRRCSRPCRSRRGRRSPGSTSRASTRRSRRCAELVAAGARAVELMVAPALIVAATTSAARPESWRELDPSSAALLVEFGGDDDAELDAAEARGRRGARRPRADPRRRSSTATPRRSRSTGRCARACTAWSARCARRARR